MMNNDFDNCESNDNVPFCNGASPFAVILKVFNRKHDYNYHRDCLYGYCMAYMAPPPETCPFAPNDIEEWKREGDKDIYTSDYIGEV